MLTSEMPARKAKLWGFTLNIEQNLFNLFEGAHNHSKPWLDTSVGTSRMPSSWAFHLFTSPPCTAALPTLPFGLPTLPFTTPAKADIREAARRLCQRCCLACQRCRSRKRRAGAHQASGIGGSVEQRSLSSLDTPGHRTPARLAPPGREG
jgi:hypothetical protein